MNLQQLHHEIDLRNGQIDEKKLYLKRTDYQSIRESEGGEPMPQEVKAARAQARIEINGLQEEVSDLETQLAAAQEAEPSGEEE